MSTTTHRLDAISSCPEAKGLPPCSSCDCFVLFHFRRFAFTEAMALRPIVLRHVVCAPTATRVSFFFSLFFFLFFFLKKNLNASRDLLSIPQSVFCCLKKSLYGEVAFSEYFCTITAFSLYGEYVVLRFPLPDGVFLPCDNGPDIGHQLTT